MSEIVIRDKHVLVREVVVKDKVIGVFIDVGSGHHNVPTASDTFYALTHARDERKP